MADPSPDPAANGEPVRFVEPIRAVRTFETAIEHIVAGIERGRLRAGNRLPSEAELAQQLGISKPTLRQALRVLERAGLLVVKLGRTGGIFLASDFLPTDAISSSIAVEEHAVFETLRARRLIETTITQEAVLAATPDDLAEIERTVDLVGSVGIGSAQVLRADMMFHRAVARAAHNRVLEEALAVVYRNLAPIRDTYKESAEEAALVYAIHRDQLAAMRSGNPETLARSLDAHFRYVEERFAASLGSSWGDVFDATGRPVAGDAAERDLSAPRSGRGRARARARA